MGASSPPLRARPSGVLQPAAQQLGQRGDRHLPLLVRHRDELRLTQHDRIMARPPGPPLRLASTHLRAGSDRGSWRRLGRPMAGPRAALLERQMLTDLSERVLDAREAELDALEAT